MSTPLPRIAVSPKEAADLLGVSRDHIDDLRYRGELAWSKSGSRVLIDYASLVEHFEKNRVTS